MTAQQSRPGIPGWIFLGFGAAAVFLLISEHRAHAADALLWVVVLGCVVMHFFMHGSHGSHGSHGAHGSHGRPEDNEHDDGGGAPDQ